MDIVDIFHLTAFGLIMLSGLIVIIMILYISRRHLKVMDRIVHGSEFIVDDIFHKMVRINGYTGIFTLKRNREREPPEVQEKVMALDKGFRLPFIIYFWILMIFGIFLLAAFILDTFFIEPSG